MKRNLTGENKKMCVSRRTVMKSIAGSAAFSATGLAPFVISARESDTLVVNAYGGQYQKIFLKTVVKPFEKKFGVKVTYDPTGRASKDYAKIRASRGSPGFDVAAAVTPPEILLGAKEKLLLKVTDREVPNLKYCWDRNTKIIPPHGIVNSYQYLGIYYNPSKISRPESWENYWDPGKHYGEKIKGHVLTWDPAGLKSIYALIMAAKLGGGGVHNMAPAWEYLKKQKPYVGPVLRGSSAAVPYFENGELWLAAYWSARGALYQARGVPMELVIPKEGTFTEADCAAIPIGTKNKKLAYEFLNFRLDKDVQRDFCLAYKIGPARKDITDWPKEFAGQQITTQADLDKAIFPDLEVIGAKRKEWTIKWQGIMGA